MTSNGYRAETIFGSDQRGNARYPTSVRHGISVVVVETDGSPVVITRLSAEHRDRHLVEF